MKAAKLCFPDFVAEFLGRPSEGVYLEPLGLSTMGGGVWFVWDPRLLHEVEVWAWMCTQPSREGGAM
jgi:hypothetical protein